MIQRVYERVAQAAFDEVLVATDDERIFACVESFGGKAVMTASDHPTGTDRIAEAVKGLNTDLIVNVQGDEPLIPPNVLDDLVNHMHDHPEAAMGTIARPIAADGPEFGDPNVVKCVRDEQGFALYFSRASIPYARDERPSGAQPLHHWGVYAYRRSFLQEFVTWPQGRLEQCEKLEQLRALEHGVKIYVMVCDIALVGVDTPEDIARVEAILRQKGEV